jgi:divalent metal cation (Fe/Co/Zn/Cd) transporter
MDFQDAIPLFNSLAHGAVQLVLALGTGALIDFSAATFLPKARGKEIQCISDAILEAIEVAGQVMIGSVVLGAVMNYLASLPGSQADPAAGFVFSFMFFGVAQPYLRVRSARLMDYVREQVLQPADDLVGFFNGVYRENSASTAAGTHQVQQKVGRQVASVPEDYGQQNPQSARKITDNTALVTGTPKKMQ